MAIQFGDKQFTSTNESRVENYIRIILEKIVELVLKESNPVGIFVYGSLGRGEGTAKVEEDKVILYSDFEIGFVSNTIKDRKIVRILNQQILEATGQDVSLSYFTSSRIRKGTNSNFSLLSRQSKTIETYELTESAFFLYGEDNRTHNSFVDPTNIPVWEGIRCIFNRLAEHHNSVLTDNKSKLAKTANKLRIVCGDAILLLEGKYHYLYSTRSKYFNSMGREYLYHTYRITPEEIERINRGYVWKQKPGERVDENNTSLLKDFELAVHFLTILFENQFNKSIHNSEEMALSYRHSVKLKNEYYKGPSGLPVIQNSILFMQKRINYTQYILSLFDSKSKIHECYLQVLEMTIKVIDELKINQEIKYTDEMKKTLGLYSNLME